MEEEEEDRERGFGTGTRCVLLVLSSCEKTMAGYILRDFASSKLSPSSIRNCPCIARRLVGLERKGRKVLRGG